MEVSTCHSLNSYCFHNHNVIEPNEVQKSSLGLVSPEVPYPLENQVTSQVDEVGIDHLDTFGDYDTINKSLSVTVTAPVGMSSSAILKKDSEDENKVV